MSMITKGKVSAVQGDKLTVILPEHEGIVTPPLIVYGGNKMVSAYKPNEFVVVLLFSDDFSDGVVIGKSASSSECMYYGSCGCTCSYNHY